MTEGTTVEQHPKVQRAATRLREVYLARQRTELQPPIDGHVAKRAVQVGQRVQAGAPLMTIVALDALWVDANFKEGQLDRIHIGQPATLLADVYGTKTEYHGKVAGLGAGTGAAFALLPAQNATGNSIKIVERVPVRIARDVKELATHAAGGADRGVRPRGARRRRDRAPHRRRESRRAAMSARAPAAEARPLLGSTKLLGTVALSLATFMNVLDTSIAAVSIPAISGNLGVSPSQGTWVITSFGVANAISVPLTGWLAQRFGAVRLFVASVLLFVVSSWLCGLAVSLEMLAAAAVTWTI